MNEDKIYHIYAKGQCIYHSLSSEQFSETWDMIHKFLSVYGELKKEDITYEELEIPKKEVIVNSSH